MTPAALPIRAQLNAIDPAGRDLALLRTRLYRFSDDLRWYVLAEALEEHFLAGQMPQPQTLASIRDCLASIRTTGKPAAFSNSLALSEGIDIDAGLETRADHLWTKIRAAEPPAQVVLIVGAPRSGTSHLYNLLARTGAFSYFTTASCWAWPVRSLQHPQRRLFTNFGDEIFAVDNKRTRLIPGLVMPGEAEDIWQRAYPVYTHISGRRYEVEQPRTGWKGVLDAAASAHLTHFRRSVLLAKSPFNSFRISQIEQHWGSTVTYVHIIRDRGEVADSMRRNRFEFTRDGRPLEAERAWHLFVDAVQEHAPADRTVTVRHETLLDEPGRVLAQVSESLEMEVRP